MHFQGLLDNTRRGIDDDTTNFAESLAAELIHSLLFHDEVICLDDYIVNNPGLRKSLTVYPVTRDLLLLPAVSLYKDDQYSALQQKMAANADRNAYHPKFGSPDEYLNASDLIDIASQMRISKTYQAVDLRRAFTDDFFGLLQSAYASEVLQGKHHEIADTLRAYRESKSRTGEADVLRQSDFEGGERPESRIQQFIAEERPSFRISEELHRVIRDLARYSYRNSLPSNLSLDNKQAPAIMHGEQSSIYSALNQPATQGLGIKPIELTHRLFHAKNLVLLSAQDVSDMRDTNAGMRFQEALRNLGRGDLNSDLVEVGSRLQLYMEEIEKLLHDRVSGFDDVATRTIHSAIRFSLSTSRWSANVGTWLLRDLPEFVERWEIRLDFLDPIVNATHNLGVPGLPPSEARQALFRVIRVAPFLSLEASSMLQETGLALLRRAEQIFGQAVEASIWPEGNTGYAR